MSAQPVLSCVNRLAAVGITWVDAPTAQFATLAADYKLRCKVEANPAANIDWLKEGIIISSGGFHCNSYLPTYFNFGVDITGLTKSQTNFYGPLLVFHL